MYRGYRPKAIISGLKEGSSVLEILDHDFEKRLQKADFDLLRVVSDANGHNGSSSPVIIFSTITDSNRKSPDGSLKRGGNPTMMVTKAHTHLGYADNEIEVYSDHSKIARIDISTTGPYLSIKQAIDRAPLESSVQQGSPGHPAMHLSSDPLVRRSVSAGPLFGDDEESRSGVTPGLAVLLGRSESLTDTQGRTGSVTVAGPGSSRHRTDRVGEDLPINRAIHDGDVAKVSKMLKDAHLDKLDSQGYTPF